MHDCSPPGYHGNPSLYNIGLFFRLLMQALFLVQSTRVIVPLCPAWASGTMIVSRRVTKRGLFFRPFSCDSHKQDCPPSGDNGHLKGDNLYLCTRVI